MKASRRSWPRELSLAAAVAAIGAVVTLSVGALAGLFDDSAPRGDVAILHTLRNQTLEMFDGTATEVSENAIKGLVVDVSRSGEDVPSDGCRLMWTWLDADGPTAVADRRLVSQEARHVRPEGRSCSTNARLWVPMGPGLDGYQRVAVRVDLYSGEHLLGSDVTETIPLG